MEHITQTLKDQFNDPDNVTSARSAAAGRSGLADTERHVYIGKDGGGGLGSGPGISVGSAVGAATHKYPAAMQSRWWRCDFFWVRRRLERGEARPFLS